MILVIVESPAKCKKIQEYLGKNYIVKSSFGHFCDLEKKKLGIDVNNKYNVKYNILDDKKNVINDLKKTFKKCDELYLAADNDREGEAIAWHLNEVLNKGKNNSKRILFNEITKKALLESVKNTTKININKFYAQQTRRIIDRLVGFLITPCLWKNIQSNYKKGESLSAGRVQSVVNKLIIERENEITNFQKKEYYNLDGNLSYKKNNIKIKYTSKINDINILYKIFELTKKSQFIITNIQNKQKIEKAKPPFITSTLQQESFNKLNMSSKKTMLIAQKLYENGLITYMRTDSINISEDALKEIKQNIINNFGEKYYKKNTFKTKTKNAQEAHECCRVTNINLKELDIKFNNDEKRLYDLIWKKTISSQMSDMVKDILEIKINLDKYQFIANEEKIIFDGFMKVYNISDKKDTNNLSKLKINTILDFIDFNAIMKFTKPESRFNDSSLIKKLEDLGIGRPSTYSNMVNSILDKKYAVIKDNDGIDITIKKFILKKNSDLIENEEIIKYGNDKNKINPTEVGFIINDYIDKYFNQIINYNFTANMEKELDLIETGNIQSFDIIDKLYKLLQSNINNLPKSNINNKNIIELGINPNNNKNIQLYLGKYGLVLKEISTDKNIKDRFISVKDFKIKDITLQKAIQLLKYPYKIGMLNDIDIILDNGIYGIYIKYNNKNYSIPNLDENNININYIIDTINNQSNNNFGLIKKINDKISIYSGQYGYYIKYNKKNYSIKIINKNNNQILDYINNLDKNKCMEIIKKK